jgi:hypothetical protein
LYIDGCLGFHDILDTGMKVCYTIFERVTMYNNAKRTQGKLQRFISTVLQFPATRYARA